MTPRLEADRPDRGVGGHQPTRAVTSISPWAPALAGAASLLDKGTGLGKKNGTTF
eukprot:CAMPEP_0204438296 /NCGR_PEP_ID=MMETSP0470-20130426/79112_1 /ASSEMBLY_ACC=CAM_ASM_000385 /TAXON_ID=2969 /ORGANISM="Oxyrrhis marina" /LENGTH=54 /DNA_ID=CAMNT_0051437111 /DNA_START=76 /DNA_END=237 /DNA_ORIENTATION=+